MARKSSSEEDDRDDVGRAFHGHAAHRSRDRTSFPSMVFGLKDSSRRPRSKRSADHPEIAQWRRVRARRRWQFRLRQRGIGDSVQGLVALLRLQAETPVPEALAFTTVTAALAALSGTSSLDISSAKALALSRKVPFSSHPPKPNATFRVKLDASSLMSKPLGKPVAGSVPPVHKKGVQ